MNILVTGAAGFIGFHLVRKLAEQGHDVTGIDNLSDYYAVSLKEARLRRLDDLAAFRFVRLDIERGGDLDALFAASGFDIVVHLAAQVGVRYSLTNPHAYVRSNVDGFFNVLEACRRDAIKHLVYASSSSVYGAATRMPFSTHQNVDHPVSLYAATKKSNELFAHTYSHLFALPTTGLRFFTVYGPWGRPDMAPSLFAHAILTGKPIKIFNHGRMERDFTYVDDIVEAVARIATRIPGPDARWTSDDPDPASSAAPYRLFNIGNRRPERLMRLIELMEACIGREAVKEFLPMQPGDVVSTYADIDDLAQEIGFAPETPLEVGIERFVRWYRDYHAL